LLEQTRRQRLSEITQAAVHDEQVPARTGYGVIGSGFQALQHPEQREGDAHLKEDQ
jgi:hypothetical protein